MTPDPAGMAATDPANPQSWNRYAYVLNNPAVNIDPTGLACVWDEKGKSWFDDNSGGESCADAANSDAAEENDPAVTVTGSPGNVQFETVAVIGALDSAAVSTGSVAGLLNGGAPPPQPQTPGSQTTGCQLVAPTGKYGTAKGVDASFNPTTAQMLSTALANLNQQGIVPVITSGYRSPAQQGALRSSNIPFVITPASVSWHEVGGAVDFGPNSNAGNFPAIRAAMMREGFVWGGNFGAPDPNHFQSQPAGTSPTAAMVQACARVRGGG